MANLIQVVVHGVEHLKKHLKKAEDQAREAVRVALYKGGQQIRTTAVLSIMNGPKTGAMYPAKKGRSKPHRASAPGEAPAADTGNLARSIKVARENHGDTVYVYVSNDAPYGKWLEFGTRGIAKRPFLRPAFLQHRSEIDAHIKAAFNSGHHKG